MRWTCMQLLRAALVLAVASLVASLDGPTSADVICNGTAAPPANPHSTMKLVNTKAASGMDVYAYTCDLGYWISKGTTAANLTCTEDLWSMLPAPTCTLVDCGQPASGTRVKISGPTANTYGTKITYTCPPGYYRSGLTPADTTLMSTCLATGSWSELAPTCLIVNCSARSMSLANASVGGTARYEYGKAVNYTCNKGYYVNSSSVSTKLTSSTCLITGLWDTPVPVCVRVFCPGLPTTMNDGRVLGRSYFYDDMVTFQCTVGYYISGQYRKTTTSKSLACQDDGTWNPSSSSLPTCTIVTCQPRTATLRNGQVINYDNKYPTNVTYQCNIGFFIFGLPQAIRRGQSMCQVDGTWSPTGVPSCYRKSCPSLTAQDGSVTFNRSNKYQSVATFTCNKGYYIQGKSATVTVLKSTCLANRTWIPPKPICAAVTCPALSPRLSNGGISGMSTRYLTKVTYLCSIGYYITSSTSQTTQQRDLTCQLDATWDNKVPTCSPVDCQTPGTSLANGVVTGRTFTFPNAVNYTCKQGYHISTKPVLTTSFSLVCQDDGTWNGTKPSCSVVNCGRLPSTLVNGTVTGSSYTFGKTVVFQCKTGTLISKETATARVLECLVNGKWNDTVPTCSVVVTYCSALIIPANGKFTLSNSLALGSTANFKCATGYRLSGSAQRTCLLSKSWSGTLTTCQNINECSTTTDTCNRVNGSCIDTAGSYTCKCNIGFSGDGRSCTAVCSSPCIPGQGSCVAPDTCHCVNGHSGLRCENLWPSVAFEGNFRLPNGTTTASYRTLVLTSIGDYYPGRCAVQCFQAGFIYAGMSNGKGCACSTGTGDFTPLKTVGASFPCVGAPSFSCGGTAHLAVYQLSPVPPANVSIASAGSNTLAANGRFYTLVNKAVALKCFVGTPSMPLLYSWWHAGTLLSSGRKGRRLTVASSSKSDSGLYTCSAVNLMVPSSSQNFSLPLNANASVFVDIQEPPQAFLSNASLTVVQGSRLEIPCSATGDAGTMFTWAKVGTSQLTPISTPVPGKLIFNPVDFSAQARYICTAFNPNIVDANRRTSQAFLSITVWVPPGLQANMSTLTGFFGQSVNLQAHLLRPVNPVPISQDIQWYKNDQWHTPLLNLNTDPYTLSILQLSEAGVVTYTCVVKTVAGSGNATVYLTVLAPPNPRVNATEAKKSVVLNRDVTFVVYLEPPIFPKPAADDIVWTHSQAILRKTASVSKDRLVLSIRNATLLDAGTYSCTVTTIAGSKTVNMELDVLVPPMLVSLASGQNPARPEQAGEVTQGKEIRMHVDFTSPPNPYPRVVWSFRGLAIANSSRSTVLNYASSADLILAEAQLNQTGIYRVTITSDATSTSTSHFFNLTVAVAPLVASSPASAGSESTYIAVAVVVALLAGIVFVVIVIVRRRRAEQAYRMSTKKKDGTGETGIALDDMHGGRGGAGEDSQYDTLRGARRPSATVQAAHHQEDQYDHLARANRSNDVGGGYAAPNRSSPMKAHGTWLAETGNLTSMEAEYDVLGKPRGVQHTAPAALPGDEYSVLSSVRSSAFAEGTPPDLNDKYTSRPTVQPMLQGSYQDVDVSVLGISSQQRRASVLMAELDTVAAAPKPAAALSRKTCPNSGSNEYAQPTVNTEVSKAERPSQAGVEYRYTDLQLVGHSGSEDHTAGTSPPQDPFLPHYKAPKPRSPYDDVALEDYQEEPSSWRSDHQSYLDESERESYLRDLQEHNDMLTTHVGGEPVKARKVKSKAKANDTAGDISNPVYGRCGSVDFTTPPTGIRSESHGQTAKPRKPTPATKPTFS